MEKKKENWFKIRAFRKVAEEIEKLTVDLEQSRRKVNCGKSRRGGGNREENHRDPRNRQITETRKTESRSGHQ